MHRRFETRVRKKQSGRSPKLRDFCSRKDDLTSCYLAEQSGEQEDRESLQLAYHRRCEKLPIRARNADIYSDENSSALNFCLQEASLTIAENLESGLAYLEMHCANGWAIACYEYLTHFNRSEVPTKNIANAMWSYCFNRSSAEAVYAKFCEAYTYPGVSQWETALDALSTVRTQSSESGFLTYRELFATFL